MLNECNGCEYQCNLSHIDICTLGSPCPHQRSTPMTEQEYLQTCNTEQLAEWFANSGFLPCGLRECDDCKYYDKKNDDCDFNFYGSINHKQMWVEWLKQPHTTIKE